MTLWSNYATRLLNIFFVQNLILFCRKPERSKNMCSLEEILLWQWFNHSDVDDWIEMKECFSNFLFPSRPEHLLRLLLHINELCIAFLSNRPRTSLFAAKFMHRLRWIIVYIFIHFNWLLSEFRYEFNAFSMSQCCRCSGAAWFMREKFIWRFNRLSFSILCMPVVFHKWN